MALQDVARYLITQANQRVQGGLFGGHFLLSHCPAGCVFGMRLRQIEGFMSSVLDLMGLDLPVPDHTTLSRRARTWE
ncbi:hypothetical protein B5P45_04340, partial [Phyllobacterium zundukense]